VIARWPYLAFGLLDAAWFLGGVLCAGLAAAVILRKDALVRADKISGLLEGERGRGLLAAGLLLPALLAIGNAARFRIYYLTGDSADTANTVWNVAHGYGLTNVLAGGRSNLAVHFSFACAMFAPFLWVWNSVGVLAVAHGLFLGIVPLMMFALAKRQSKSRLVPWLILFLTLSHPSFQELSGTVMTDSLYALPYFIAAAYFFETDRPALGALFGALMFSAREEVPFISFGVGLYLVFKRPRPALRAGLVLMAASALIWLAELKAMAWARDGSTCWETWSLFNDLGGTQQAVLAHALTRPWDFAVALISPPVKLLAVLRILVHTGFLPLFAGAAFLPALFVWIPHQLARSGSLFQGIRGHYSSFILGPLLWAMLKGLIKLDKRCPPKHRRNLVALLLLVASWGFFTAPGFYSPDVRVIPKAWETAAPKALALIPPDAPVWVDGYLSPNLAMRRYIKMLPYGPRDCVFEDRLFLPDYVLLSAYWANAFPPAAEMILGLLRDREFEPIFKDADLIILANPKRESRRGEPERIKLPDDLSL
jgi:uncharacterized membrane protein